jgi:hypothetical protein
MTMDRAPGSLPLPDLADSGKRVEQIWYDRGSRCDHGLGTSNPLILRAREVLVINPDFKRDRKIVGLGQHPVPVSVMS